ncbi:hypothetical protein PMAYCL1PPCAC_17589, partial [Pristionchus mayeri]
SSSSSSSSHSPQNHRNGSAEMPPKGKAPSRKKKTVVEEESSLTTTGGSGGGGSRKRSNKRKTTVDETGGEGTKGKKKEKQAPLHLEKATCRKKKTTTTAEDKMEKSAWAEAPCIRPVENVAPPPVEGGENVVDPERDLRTIDGRDPENMTEKQMENLRAIVAQFESMGVKGLLDEFESIKGYNITPFKVEGHESNPTKNRYKDIFCIDKTRIKLTTKGKKGGEYIHANYVKLPPLLNTFVTTQGPIEGTVNDFWKLVVQEKVGYIFMLCSIMELGKKKCEQYYPLDVDSSIKYGEVQVKLISTHTDNHFVNSKFELTVKGQPKRFLYHHNWRDWPDHGVPITAMACLRLLRHARLTNYSTIVHCSAGVGRTGTLVAIEWMLQKILSSPPPYNMKEMLREMRNQRGHAIQTAPQYAYIAFVIFRLLATKDSKMVQRFVQFSQDMQIHTGVKLDGGAGGGTGPVKTAATAKTAMGP